MKRLALVIAAALSLAACGGKPAGWLPPDGVTRQAFERDAYECRRDALMGGDTIRATRDIAVKSEDWTLYRDCMRAHGYQGAAPGEGWFPAWGKS